MSMMGFFRRHSTSWDSPSKSWGTRRLFHSRTEQDSMSSDLDNISVRVGYFSTRRASLPDGQAETVRLVPVWTRGVSGRSLLQTQRTSSVRLAQRGYLVRVTERCGNGGEEVWVRITTGSQNTLLGFQKEWGKSNVLVLALGQRLDSCQVQEREPTKSPVSQEIIQVIRTQPGGIWTKKIRTENVAQLHFCQCVFSWDRRHI